MATENAKHNTRIQLKHDTETNWNKAVNFIPKAGEMIIYDADGTNPVRIKIEWAFYLYKNSKEVKNGYFKY